MNMNRLNSTLTPIPSLRKGNKITPMGIGQRGITLVMSLIFLLLLTILGVTAISTSTLQEKMSGNLRDQDVAFQAAESALRGGEDAVNLLAQAAGNRNPDTQINCTNCVWAIDTTLPLDDAAMPLDDTWWAYWKNEYGSGSKDLPETYADPSFVVEYGGFVKDKINMPMWEADPGVHYYKITSRAQGVTPVSRAMLESTYKVRY